MANDNVSEWVPVKWIRRSDLDQHELTPVEIGLMNSPFYEGDTYAVRDGRSGCLNKKGEWEYEPMPSSRDDAFYARCRFPSFEAAIQALKQEQGGE